MIQQKTFQNIQGNNFLSPPRCTQQFKAAASGKARIAAQQGELASGRAPGRDLNLFLCYLYLMLLFFLHFSHVLTKVVLLQISAFFLFSNFRKCILLYVCPVGWSISRSASPLIFSSDFRSSNLIHHIHPICLIHPIHNHSTTTKQQELQRIIQRDLPLANDQLKGLTSC